MKDITNETLLDCYIIDEICERGVYPSYVVEIYGDDCRYGTKNGHPWNMNPYNDKKAIHVIGFNKITEKYEDMFQISISDIPKMVYDNMIYGIFDCTDEWIRNRSSSYFKRSA
jgi:hypothetical protein